MVRVSFPHEHFDIAGVEAAAITTIRAAANRTLPARYHGDLWDRRFRQVLHGALRPELTLLDIGSGRHPTLAIEERPPGMYYVGLDIDSKELSLAAPGSYDETVIGSAEERAEALVGRFDLVLSFFAIEHVQSTAATFANARDYLRSGGRLIAQMSGSYSPFSIANRLFPAHAARRLLAKTQGRAAESVFPANYNKCSYAGLTEITSEGWHDARVVPLFTGAGYVLFSRLLTAVYVGYEEWAYRTDQKNLAPYYLVIARR